MRFLVPGMLTPLLAAIAASPCCAQCAQSWGPQQTITGLDGNISAMTIWDPDGSGPLSARLVVGGTIFTAGGTPTRNIAAWDPATGAWSTLGAGLPNLDPSVYPSGVGALAVLPSGDLIAAPYWWVLGYRNSQVYRWTGGAWTPMGPLFSRSDQSSFVYALAIGADGAPIAGGGFCQVGSGCNIGRWDGAAWSSLPGGPNNDVYGVAPLSGGGLIAGGGFSSFGQQLAGYIARWDGASWSPLGSGVNNIVDAVATLHNGDVVVGGSFTTAGGVFTPLVARWNGSAWHALPGLVGTYVLALLVLPDDRVVAAGSFTSAGGTSAHSIAVWNGAGWTPLASNLGVVYALARLPGGDVVAGTDTSVGWPMARWSPSTTCRADFDCSGTANTADIFAYINAWFASDPRAEFDGLTGLTVQDIFAFVNAWFAGC